MELLLWIVLGITAGWLISISMGTRSAQGWITDITLGIIGALVGGLIINILGQPGVPGFNLYSVMIAALGSIALIWLGKVVSTTD